MFITVDVKENDGKTMRQRKTNERYSEDQSNGPLESVVVVVLVVLSKLLVVEELLLPLSPVAIIISSIRTAKYTTAVTCICTVQCS